jgi:hypothetical protein
MPEGVQVRFYIGLGAVSQQPIRSVGGNRLLLKSLDEENPIGHMVLTSSKVLLASGSAAEPCVRDEQMSTNRNGSQVHAVTACRSPSTNSLSRPFPGEKRTVCM